MSGGVDSHRIEVLEAKLVGVRSELQRQRKVAAKSKDELEKLLGLVEAQNAITDQLSATPAWLAPKRSESNLHATAWLTLSDLHLDEVVIRSQSAGLNSYNRKIAEKRLTAVIENTIAVFDEQITGLQLDGIVCALGGDIITGDIHEELMKTNESSVPETIVHWVPVLASAIGRLADRFGKVHVPCVSGNHDRTGKKIQFKNRAQESFSWIIYHWIAAELADDDRVTFDIAEGADKMVKVYKTRFMLTHGDGFRGGGGVGGIFPAMNRWLLRKHQVTPFDIAVMGHWHSLQFYPTAFINGSLKGYDEYAIGHGFSFERPQQMLFVITPENGVTIQTAAYAD